MKRKNNKGFSLIELIIAIAILVILTGLLAPQFMRYMEKSREAKDMQTLDTLYGAVQVALADEAAYKDVKGNADLTGLGTTGMTLDNLLKVDKAFVKEILVTFPGASNTKLWTSKAVVDAIAHTDGDVYVMVDPTTLKVSVWVGIKGAGGVVTEAAAINPDSTKVVAGVTTVGATFFISK